MYTNTVRLRDVRDAIECGADDLREIYKRYDSTYDFIHNFCRPRRLHCIARSYGKYGVSGVICEDVDGKLYACPDRSAATMVVFDM